MFFFIVYRWSYQLLDSKNYFIIYIYILFSIAKIWGGISLSALADILSYFKQKLTLFRFFQKTSFYILCHFASKVKS